VHTFTLECITPGISPQSLLGQMVFPVNLDNQPQVKTNKVQGVAPKRVFSTEFLTEHSTRTNHLPDILCKLISLPTLITRKINAFGLTFV
jgi:hypothetical protein